MLQFRCALRGVFALLLLPAFLLAVFPSPGRSADGFPVCNAPGDQDSPSLALATDLATWVAWRDLRRSDSTIRTDVYVERLNPLIPAPAKAPVLESLALTADGIAVCSSGTAGPPIAVASDSGGVLILWGDARTARGIYAQRLRADGSRYPGWPVDGRLISGDVEDLTLVACTDGAGGAYFARKPAPLPIGSQRITLTRMTKSGAFAPGWTEAGVLLGSDQLVQGVTLAADPSGGAVFTIRLFLDAGAVDPQYGRAGRVTSTGSLALAVNLTGWRSGGFSPGIVGSNAIANGSGGLHAAWNDAPGPQFYGQSWNAAGVPQWPDSLPAPHMDALLPDGAGGVYLVGREKQDLSRLSVQRRDALGGISPPWDAVGRLLAQPLGLAQVGAISDPAGVFVFWSEFRGGGGGFDIRGSLVRPSGRLEDGWVGGGDPLCDAPGNQTNVVGVAGSRVLAWVDERDLATTKKDLWAKYILGPDGTLDVAPLPTGPPGARIRAVFPNPARDELRVSLALRPGASARFDLIDLRGRIVRHVDLADVAGEDIVVLDTRGLASGLYALRVIQAGQVDRARVVVVR